MATEHLLEEFPPVSTAEWEAAIARDLKGADYEKKLIWRTEEGLAVKPYYRAEDFRAGLCGCRARGVSVSRGGARAQGDWRIREEIDAPNARECESRCASSGGGGCGRNCVSAASAVANRGRIRNALVANLGEIPVHFERADEQTIRLLIGG